MGVRRSLSRPRVSNDNPHAEAGFKTLKYRPDWPTRFTDIDHATTHCDTFFKWYNNEHHHTAIGLLTPNDRHAGNGQRINTARQTVLDAAYRAHPEAGKVGSGSGLPAAATAGGGCRSRSPGEDRGERS